MGLKHIWTFAIVAVAALFLCTTNALGDDIKDRMKARLPVINELKAQGLVGENNQGLLEFRTGHTPQADVVAAENQDRRQVYKAIAARHNATPEFVGQTRAAQIADKEPSGFWIQNADGSWTKK